MAFHRFREDEPTPIKASLDRLTDRIGAPKTTAFSAVFAGWADLVGPTVAAHATPRSLKDGRLVVYVDDPAWATQIRFLETELRDRIAAAAGPGVVSELVVRVAR